MWRTHLNKRPARVILFLQSGVDWSGVGVEGGESPIIYYTSSSMVEQRFRLYDFLVSLQHWQWIVIVHSRSATDHHVDCCNSPIISGGGQWPDSKWLAWPFCTPNWCKGPLVKWVEAALSFQSIFSFGQPSCLHCGRIHMVTNSACHVLGVPVQNQSYHTLWWWWGSGWAGESLWLLAYRPNVDWTGLQT